MNPREPRKRPFAATLITLWSVLALPAAAGPPPNGRFANSGDPGRCDSQPAPGLVIDAHNVASYQCFLPAAAILMVKHGFKVRIGASHKFEWPARFKQATEKYSPQVHLDGEDNLTDYVAGMPFPFVNVDDPKAARKIAYNWHMGPFMPDDFSLAPWDSFGYSDASSAVAQPVRSEPDYTYICNHFDFLRFAHRTEVDPRPLVGGAGQEFEWKARCNEWNESAASVHGGRSIWLRFLDPHRPDECFVFSDRTRKVRRMAISPPYLDHQCRACHQPYWAYALPKTEAYSYRLLGATPILACMTTDDEPAGFVGRAEAGGEQSMQGSSDAMALGVEPFEMRSAYIIEMIPVEDRYSNLRALVWIDTESYVWLGAEFFESSTKTASAELQEVAFPLWRTRPAEGGGSLFDLAGSFYVPVAYQPALSPHPEPASSTPLPHQPWFFRSVVPAHGPYDQKINAGSREEAIFNPRSLAN